MTIREHQLAWRWTDPEHAVLPDGTLAKMLPIEKTEADDLFRRSHHLVVAGGLARREFATIARASADVSPEVGRDWLRRRQPDMEVPVVISWDQSAAIRTTWEVFTAHWDVFCYPASDDVLVFPDTESWALFYFHEEQFQFGRRSMAEPIAAPNGGPAAQLGSSGVSEGRHR